MFDNIEDVRSDFSVFHHLAELDELDAHTFLQRAVRLPAYSGATQRRQQLQVATQPAAHGAQAPASAPEWADPDNTPPEVIAQLRAGVIAAAHGGKPVDQWLSHDEIMEEALKYGG